MPEQNAEVFPGFLPAEAETGRATTDGVTPDVPVVAFTQPRLRSREWSCRYGRKLRLILPRVSCVAFLHLSDPERSHDFLGWRDNPSVMFTAEDPALVRLCRLCIEGQISVGDLAYHFESREPVVSESPWRRLLLAEWCGNATPVPPMDWSEPA